jgi:hypothetical protein
MTLMMLLRKQLKHTNERILGSLYNFMFQDYSFCGETASLRLCLVAGIRIDVVQQNGN